MTNKRSTKKALIFSVLSLVLCLTMLVGTTFAWFTDSVTSGKNTIVAGNLDVKVEYSHDGETWYDMEAASDLFDSEALWEPGYTSAVALRITNVGDLALKYQISTVVYNETESTNVLGNQFKLSNYLKMYACPVMGTAEDALSAWVNEMMQSRIFGDRTAATGNGTTMTQHDFDEVIAGDDNLTAGESHVTYLAITMPTTVGNEANYDKAGGYAAPSIEFGVNVVATQTTYESDGFGTDYDQNSLYTTVATADELVAALQGGLDEVILTADITLTDGASLEVAEAAKTVLNLNGHIVTNPVVGAAALINNGTLTITGEGKIVNGTNDTKASHTIRNYGTLVIESGDIGTDDTAGAALMNEGIATINGGTFASKQENTKADGLCAYIFINNAADAVLTVNNATVNGETHGLFGAYSGEIIVNGGSYTLWGNGGLGCYLVYTAAAGKVTLNAGSYTTIEPRSNRYFYVYSNGNHFNDAAVATGNIVVANGVEIILNPTVVSTTEDLITALAAGENVVLSGNVTVDKADCTTTTSGSKTYYTALTLNGGVLDGNGYTISAAEPVESEAEDKYHQTYGVVVTGGTLRNVTLDGFFRGIMTTSALTEDLYIDNVTVANCVYGMNIGNGNGYNMYVTNSSFCEWVSYSGLKEVKFTDCEFTTNGLYIASTRIYESNTTFTNCVFRANTEASVNASAYGYAGKYGLDNYGKGGTANFVDCHVDETLLTADNYTDLLKLAYGISVTVE